MGTVPVSMGVCTVGNGGTNADGRVSLRMWIPRKTASELKLVAGDKVQFQISKLITANMVGIEAKPIEEKRELTLNDLTEREITFISQYKTCPSEYLKKYLRDQFSEEFTKERISDLIAFSKRTFISDGTYEQNRKKPGVLLSTGNDGSPNK